MAYISNFAKAAGLVSQHRADPSSKSTTISGDMRRLDRESMSPTKRTKRWLEAPTPVKETTIHKVKGSKITKPGHDRHKNRSSFWGLPLLANFLGKKPTIGIDNIESETAIGDDTPVPTTEYDNDSTLVADGDDYDEEFRVEKTERTLQDYRSDCNLDHNDPRFKEWTDDENWFFTRLRNRGREPLFDHTWAMDFPTYPDSLFTKDPNQVFINSTNCNLYRGKSLFLQELPRVTQANTFPNSCPSLR